MNVDLISVLVAVVAVGVGLAGLVLASWRGVRLEMREMRHEMRGEIHEIRQDMGNHMGRIDSQIAALRERIGRVEGLLQGLRKVFIPRTAD